MKAQELFNAVNKLIADDECQEGGGVAAAVVIIHPLPQAVEENRQVAVVAPLNEVVIIHPVPPPQGVEENRQVAIAAPLNDVVIIHPVPPLQAVEENRQGACVVNQREKDIAILRAREDLAIAKVNLAEATLARLLALP